MRGNEPFSDRVESALLCSPVTSCAVKPSCRSFNKLWVQSCHVGTKKKESEFNLGVVTKRRLK